MASGETELVFCEQYYTSTEKANQARRQKGVVIQLAKPPPGCTQPLERGWQTAAEDSVASVPSVAFSSKPGRYLQEKCQHGWSCSAMGTRRAESLSAVLHDHTDTGAGVRW